MEDGARDRGRSADDADLPDPKPPAPPVVELWAGGIQQGIMHNRPEVIGVEVDIQQLEQEFAQEVRELEDRAEESSRKELGTGED